jgi:hypothetical protein
MHGQQSLPVSTLTMQGIATRSSVSKPTDHDNKSITISSMDQIFCICAQDGVAVPNVSRLKLLRQSKVLLCAHPRLCHRPSKSCTY